MVGYSSKTIKQRGESKVAWTKFRQTWPFFWPQWDGIAELWGFFNYIPEALGQKLIGPCVQASSAKNHY